MRARPLIAFTLVAACLLALGAAPTEPASAASRWVLPFPVEPVDIRALSVRAEAVGTEEGTWSGHVVLTVVNTADAPRTLTLVCPAPAGAASPVTVKVADQALDLSDSEAGRRAMIEVHPGEAVAIEVTQPIEPALLPVLPASDAGWYGSSRGAVVQPMLQLVLVAQPGSPFAGAPHELRVQPAGTTLANLVFPSAGARFADGAVSWSLPAGLPGGGVSLAWAADPNDTFLPRSAAEAKAFVEYWSARELNPDEIGRVAQAEDDAAKGTGVTPRAARAGGEATLVADTLRAFESASRSAQTTRMAVVSMPTDRPTPKPKPAPAAAASASAAPKPPAKGTASRSKPPAPAAAAPSREGGTGRRVAHGTTTPPRRAAQAPRTPPEVATLSRPKERRPPTEAETESPAPSTPPPMTARLRARVPRAEPVPAPLTDVTWLRNAADVRVFLARERTRGPLDPQRIAEAIVIIEARHGNPFSDDPEVRARFDGEPWYIARRNYTEGALSTDAVEAITLLREALASS